MSKLHNYNSKLLKLLIFISLLFSLACRGPKASQSSKLPIYQQILDSSPIFNSSYTGFQLYDPASEKILFSKNASRYFTPASNTKLFTLYTALQLLGDSIPGLKYVVKGDSLLFWGTGDPSLRNPYLSANNQVIDFLANQELSLYFSSNNFKDKYFGAGWCWDDYYYYFQPEKSAFPYHGNVIKAEKALLDSVYQISPLFFQNKLVSNDSLKSRSIIRVEDQNIFEYGPHAFNREYDNEHPFKFSDDLLIQLLGSDIQGSIGRHDIEQSSFDTFDIVYSVKADTLYRQLMRNSDNFIAEQLLLVCSDALFGSLNTEQVINYSIDSLLKNSPDEPIWVDGSGLSRYNLFTPRTIVYVLDQLYKDLPTERLFHLFAAGGVSGTIEHWYKGKDKPYVFAKTGTLSNNHCLSGYIITSSGKTLIFSFMHNNFKGSSSPFKQEMEKVLQAIYINY